MGAGRCPALTVGGPHTPFLAQNLEERLQEGPAHLLTASREGSRPCFSIPQCFDCAWRVEGAVGIVGLVLLLCVCLFPLCSKAGLELKNLLQLLKC